MDPKYLEISDDQIHTGYSRRTFKLISLNESDADLSDDIKLRLFLIRERVIQKFNKREI